MIHLVTWLLAASIVIPLIILAVLVVGGVGSFGLAKLGSNQEYLVALVLVIVLLIIAAKIFGLWPVVFAFAGLAILDNLLGWSDRMAK